MIDDVDIKILSMLQKNGRTKRSQLAETIGMSIPSISERLQKLETNGVIEGYHAKVNRKEFGYDIMAFITVVMESSKHYKTLIDNVNKIPQITECYSMLGEGSHILKAIVKDSASLENLLSQIQSWPGVVRTVTSFVLSTIKESSYLEISTNNK
jgi:Lrp/AsnC family leucine-responsive transcriptional regulator